MEEDMDNPWVVKVDEYGKSYIYNVLDETKILKGYYFDEEENLVEDNLIDHAKKLNESYKTSIDVATVDDMITPFEVPTYMYKYSLKNRSTSTHWYPSVRVSSFGVYPTTVNFSTNVTTSESWAISAGASTVDIKNLLRLNAGGTWNSSSSTGSSYGGSHTMIKDTCAALLFTAKGKKITGTVYQDKYSYSGVYISSQNLGISSGITPLKLSNGLTDGFISVESYSISECKIKGLVK